MELHRTDRIFVAVTTWVITCLFVLGLIWVVDQERPDLFDVVFTGLVQAVFIALRWPESRRGQLIGLGCTLAVLAICAFRGNWAAVLILSSVAAYGAWQVTRVKP